LVRALVGRRRVVPGPGCEPAALETEPFPSCPPGPVELTVGCGPAGVDLELGVDGITDPPLQRPQRFFAGFALRDFPVVVGASRVVTVADLGAAAMWMAWLRNRLPRRDSR
jgi:hypothetical protein